MAYMSQERKAEIAPVVKAICKKYGVKATLSVRNHSTLSLNIKSGKLDFMNNFDDNRIYKNTYIQVNTYWYHEHFSGNCKKFLEEVISAMNVGNHDHSDIQSDYFNVGWYVNVNVGKWDKPYQLTA